MAPLPSPESNGGFNIFAAKACQCLRALGSVMVMIVLSLILLTYYTTVFAVYGRIALSHNSKSQAATGVIVVYNFLVRARGGVSAAAPLAACSRRLPTRLQVFMLLWSYFAAVLTEPGRVPPGWQPSDGDEEVRAARVVGVLRSPSPSLCPSSLTRPSCCPRPPGWRTGRPTRSRGAASAASAAPGSRTARTTAPSAAAAC